jgi:exosortase A-associated hydrolase 1
MRRLLSFNCEGHALGGTLDDAPGVTGLLIVTGGSQTRIGSHRMFERLAAAVAAAGHPCFRFDRRGVGDSEGDDPGYRGSGDDLAAAAAAFRAACPQVRRIVGFGLCDGATALALFGRDAQVDSLLLANPWFVEAEAGAPPPAAIKRHYRDQLLSLSGWKRLLSGGVSYRKLARGLLRIGAPAAPNDLASDVAHALGDPQMPVRIVLAERDATAIAAREVWNSAGFRPVRDRSLPPAILPSDSHTFARPGDEEALRDAVLDAVLQS